ncbi:nitroreductase family protein [Acinetobacter bereziniae]|uniref:nitroreductase family protein n=1 Tax=Acinetobacter bereziniae TaxID=106648 RepID=UPI001900F2A6|nr:nitroreductase family protein [Acinetobacter bereziniae]MBJ9948685.1 nitroreductase family protein [Acinetobacter bereziniae]
MTWVNLGNPVPKQKVDKYIPYKWDLSNKSIRLDEPEIFTPIPFTQVMFERKSQRSFKLVSIDHLSHLLWLTNRVKDCIDSTMGFPITLRPVPSAGAIHPIHILINSPYTDVWWRYDPFCHSLWPINKESKYFINVRRDCEKILNCNSASLILLIAEPQKTLSKYTDGASLVWRDAGVLLGNLALVASYLNINFCPIGALLPTKIDEKKQLVTVGMAVLDAIKID